MVKLSYEKDEAILIFPKQLVATNYVQKFLERLRLEAIAEKNEMTEAQAWDLSEQIKQEWWQNNKERMLKGIKR